MPQKILIIDDDAAFVKVVAQTLKDYGFETVGAGTGKAGIALATKQKPDLVILDLSLPGMHGLDICQRLKQQVATASLPILILTGNDREGQDIVCLDMGADDYLSKPIKADRLLAHCRALLRRQQQPDSGKSPAPLRRGVLKLDYAKKIAWLNEKQFDHLTPKEFGILYDLAANSPEPRDQVALYRDIWGIDPPSELSLKTIDVHIRRIRLKMGWKSDEWIFHVSGRGYCLKTR